MSTKLYAIKRPDGTWIMGRTCEDQYESWSHAAQCDHALWAKFHSGNRKRCEAAGYRCVEVEVVKAGGRVCEWTEDTEGTFVTSCGNYFQFTADGPKENKFQFCPYCGGKIVEAQGGKKEGGK